MTKVTLNGYIIVPDSQLELIQAALTVHIALTRREKGCLVFEVSQDPQNINKFNVYEEFIDQLAFSAHQVRVAESDWGAASKHLVRDYQVSGLQETL